MSNNREEAVSKDRREKMRVVLAEFERRVAVASLDGLSKDYLKRIYKCFDYAITALEALMPREEICPQCEKPMTNECQEYFRQPQEVSIDEIMRIILHTSDYAEITHFPEHWRKKVARAIHAKIYGKGKETR